MGDVDGGGAEPALQRGDLGAGLHAQLGVQVRQRLVHAEHLRLAHDGAAHRDALTLTAGELGGLAVQELGEVETLAASSTFLRRSSADTPRSFSAKPMFSATVLLGYSA